MVLTKAQYDDLFSENTMKRHGLAKSFRHWDHGIVPVKFDKGFDITFIERVKNAMRYISSVSCIKFDWKNVPTSDHIFVTRAKKCSSSVRLFLSVNFLKK